MPKYTSPKCAGAAVDEKQLPQSVPGHAYDAATMLRDAYHGGQIAMLKKVIRAKKSGS